MNTIGLIGLAVMGQNLALNLRDKGFKVAVFNRTYSKTKDFMSKLHPKQKKILGFENIKDFVNSLEKPRKIILMVKAGTIVDEYINKIEPYLSSGDIIIDGGNSHFPDTTRRVAELEKKDILFIGTGISGGEEGARFGPSIMPGGNEKAWPFIKPILQSIAAKTPEGTSCCDWVGNDGAGHFVKMVHNGIEYGDMQLISESYDLLKTCYSLSNEKMAEIFTKWNKSELNSYLIEITAKILKFKEANNAYLLDKILDKAGQKGTGKWTAIAGLNEGIPISLITEAVFARSLSAMKEERITASNLIGSSTNTIKATENDISDLQSALLTAKLISYAQGFMLIKAVSEKFDWSINYGNIALMWREGCIIRSVFLDKIHQAYLNNPSLQNLVLDPYFSSFLLKGIPAMRRTLTKALSSGIPMPCFASALSFYDSYRREQLPANLIQAMRDYFGAHTFQRKDDETGNFYHNQWDIN